MRFGWIFPAILVVIAGCDDTLVTDKVTEVLTYGSVAAEVQCASSSGHASCGVLYGGASVRIAFKAYRMQDGSTLFSFTYNNGMALPTGLQFIPRGEGVVLHEVDPYAAGNNTIFTFNGTSASITSDPLPYGLGCPEGIPIDVNFDIPSEMTCTGRNLAAFGVEE